MADTFNDLEKYIKKSFHKDEQYLGRVRRFTFLSLCFSLFCYIAFLFFVDSEIHGYSVVNLNLLGITVISACLYVLSLYSFNSLFFASHLGGLSGFLSLGYILQAVVAGNDYVGGALITMSLLGLYFTVIFLVSPINFLREKASYDDYEYLSLIADNIFSHNPIFDCLEKEHGLRPYIFNYHNKMFRFTYIYFAQSVDGEAYSPREAAEKFAEKGGSREEFLQSVSQINDVVARFIRPKKQFVNLLWNERKSAQIESKYSLGFNVLVFGGKTHPTKTESIKVKDLLCLH